MKKETIGWIGLGTMGLEMATHILNSGYDLIVYNRTVSKAENLLKLGAKLAGSVEDLTKKSDIIFTIIGDPKSVEEVYFSKEGIINNLSENKITVDMTTTKPSLTIKIHEEALKKNCFSLDAPVSGGDVGAKNGTLSIMVGGESEIYEKIKPILEIIGKNILYQGLAGSGQHAKMANQIQIAGSMIGMCEALVYAQKANLDLKTLLQSISKGAAGCWSLDNLAPRIISGDFESGFLVEHFIKDMSIAIEESENMGLKLQGLNLVKNIYQTYYQKHAGKTATQALFLALKDQNR